MNILQCNFNQKHFVSTFALLKCDTDLRIVEPRKMKMML